MKQRGLLLLAGTILACALLYPFLWNESPVSRATDNKPESGKKYNRLIHEKSPYLLQHAENPVDWYPWGEEAFEKARKENKLIFLSIGYSTCHWCHVMERESYNDPEVAKLMNDAFVAIKVDREERPDIDNIYMNVCQMITGSGGWPLNIVMTPGRKPFYAATYIPKESRFGRVGMLELIPKLKAMWKTQRDDIVKSADNVTAALEQTSAGTAGEGLDVSVLKAAYENLSSNYDSQYAGFGDPPKFPTPHQLLFLLHYWKRTGEPKALEMAEKTLQAMRGGGIYDHAGFGFHRYSTDREWLVPHFEKMLYDQAMLEMAYVEAYQATGKQEYAATAREILTYILRDMTDPSGAFYSAEDADSEGQEGKFYLWSQAEIRRLLGSEDADFVIRLFDVRPEGNFTDRVSGEKGAGNILHLSKPLSEPERKRWESARQKLFAARQQRVHPGKDDKVLTDWNGLMIGALAKASQALDDPAYAESAGRSADFLLKNLRGADGRLLHRYRQGEAALQGNIDDYAFFTWGLMELYEATFEIKYLQAAIELNRYTLEHFWDKANGGFYFTPDNGEKLLVRSKEIYDGAVPSGNSVAMLNLLRLGRITADSDLEARAAGLQKAFADRVRQFPSGYTQLLLALDYGIGPSYEVVIAGNSAAQDTKAMLQLLRKEFVPNKIVLLRPAGQEAPEITRIAAFTKYQSGIQGKATAYVCLNYVCKAPTTDLQKMVQLLRSVQ